MIIVYEWLNIDDNNIHYTKDEKYLTSEKFKLLSKQIKINDKWITVWNINQASDYN